MLMDYLFIKVRASRLGDNEENLHAEQVRWAMDRNRALARRID